ncbi:hypothetical protein [Nostoc sp.]
MAFLLVSGNVNVFLEEPIAGLIQLSLGDRLCLGLGVLGEFL